jgi:hypothetical protein
VGFPEQLSLTQLSQGTPSGIKSLQQSSHTLHTLEGLHSFGQFSVTHLSHGAPSGMKSLQQAAQTLHVLAGLHSFLVDTKVCTAVVYEMHTVRSRHPRIFVISSRSRLSCGLSNNSEFVSAV